MGTLLFGRDETTTCITDVTVVGKDHEPLCLAYKTTKVFVGAGVWLTDDGYVLTARGTHGKSGYYPLTNAEITELQASGDLPSPLPAYSVGLGEWAIATSLYWVLAFTIVASFITGRLRKRWRRDRDAELRDRRVSFGPPSLETKDDVFVAEQLRGLLRPGERIFHQAVALDRHPSETTVFQPARTLYAALTSERVLLARAKAGLRALQPIEAVCSIERSTIAALALEDELLTLRLEDGTEHTLFVSGARKRGSNGRAFLLDVPRILAGEAEPPFAPPPRPAPPARPEPPAFSPRAAPAPRPE